jgi:hypothetical protein
MADSEEKSETTSGDTSGATSGTTSGATSGDQAPPKAESKPEPKSEPKTASKTGGKRRAEPEKTEKKAPAGSTVNKVRGYVATAVWVLAVLAAVILAVGALMVTLDFNKDNAIVDFFVTTANNLDFGIFKDFKPGKGESAHDAEVKRVLVNWGIAAIIYLVAGKILERIIRP